MKKAFLVVLMLSSSLIFAQNTISGSVSDESNNPIPGATIVIEGTTTGVVTDFDGNYQINASAGDQLTISSLGFASQTITVGNQTQINVVLALALTYLMRLLYLVIRHNKGEVYSGNWYIRHRGSH